MPALNTTSTADISFMLLVFFLVTSSMGVDKGITRRLPPVDRTENRQPLDVARSRLMQVDITADNRVLVNGKAVPVQGLRQRIEAFVGRNGKRHLISIHTDDRASYNTYFMLQDQLVAAFAALRNKEAQRRYRRSMAQCTPAQRQAVMEACPQHMTENYEEGGKP